MIEASFVNPVLFSVGGINVYSYGVCIALALAACTWALDQQCKRLGIKADAPTFMLAFIPGFYVGSKAQMVLSAFFTGDEMPGLWIDTGHSFMGSAVGGILFAAAYGYTCGLRPLRMLDVMLPLVPLGHCIGKWGCFLSGDGCYGPRAEPSLPWSMSFPNGMVPVESAVHPTPLYESLASFILFLWLTTVVPIPAPGDKKRLALGRRAAWALALYGIERMAIEPWRRHPSQPSLLGLTEYQFLAIIFILVALFVAFLGSFADPWPQAPPEAAAEPASQSENAKKKKN